MGIISSINDKLVEAGKLSLSKASKEKQDDKAFVEKVLLNRGFDEFEFASPKLKNDAQFLFYLATQYPDMAKFIPNHCVQRFKDHKTGQSKEIGIEGRLIALLCFHHNMSVFTRLPNNFAYECYKHCRKKDTIRFSFLNQSVRLYFDISDEDLNYLELVRPTFPTKYCYEANNNNSDQDLI